MANPSLLYRSYQVKFQEGTLDFKRSKLSSEINEISEITSIFVERVENDIWLPKSEFEFALLMLRYDVDFKTNLPTAINFPSHIQITSSHNLTEVFILETIIEEVGGLEIAEEIIKNKPRHAVGYTAYLHRYKGYIFNNADWRESELLKPYDIRAKYVPLNVLRNAARITSRHNKTKG